MRISILGLGKSGLAAAKLAKKHGYHVFISDSGNSNELLKKELELQGIEYEFGIHSDHVLEADNIILSPGIPRKSEIVKRCLKHNLSVISEIEFAQIHSKQAFVGITGSNGKTTTTYLVGEMLEAAFGGKRTGGNIGIPLSNIIDENDLNPIAVELSSFQLESSDKLKLKTAVLLNISPNHLDWYESMEDYVDAKLRILKNADKDSELIVNSDDKAVVSRTKSFIGKKYSFSINTKIADARLENNNLILFDEKICDSRELNLSGPHHVMNMLAASLAAKLNGVNIDIIRNVLLTFNGLEHRMENCGTIHGITFYNDSKSTTIESLKMALQSFHKKIILLAGGKHKGASYSPLKELITNKCKMVFLYGDSAEKMKSDLENNEVLHIAKNMDEAFLKANNLASNGDIVLLSPACSSFDQFKNFEDRGNYFKSLSPRF